MRIRSHADGQQRVRIDEWLAFIPSLSVVHHSSQGHIFDISGRHGVVTQCHWVRFCCVRIAVAGEVSVRRCTCNTHIKICEIPAWLRIPYWENATGTSGCALLLLIVGPLPVASHKHVSGHRADTHTKYIYPQSRWIESSIFHRWRRNVLHLQATTIWTTVCVSFRLFRPGGWLTASPLMCGVGGYRQTECGTSPIFPRAHTTHRVRHTHTHTHTPPVLQRSRVRSIYFLVKTNLSFTV